MNASKKSGLNSKKEVSLKAIEELKQAIDNVSLSDPGAWKAIEADLDSLVQGFPQNLSVPLNTIALCVRAAQVLSGNTKTQSFSLIDALSNALDAIEAYLLDKPDKKTLIQNAEQGLKDALPPADLNQGQDPDQDQDQDETPPSPSEDSADAVSTDSLDDATSLYIQLEPEDRPGLQKLHDVLLSLVENKAYSESCLKYVDASLLKIKRILDETADDPQAAFDDLSELLEKAADGAEQGDEITDSEKSPDKDSNVGSGRVESVQPEPQDNEEPVDGEDTSTVGDDLQTDHMPEDFDPDLIAEFITEGLDLISKAEEALLTLENDPQDMDAVNMVFRAFHTVKGTAAFMDLGLIAEMGHHSESLLSRVRDGEIRYGGGYADLSLRALDMLKDLISSVQKALEESSALLQPSGYSELMALLADPESAGISDDTDEAPVPRLGDVMVAQGKVERDSIEQVAKNHPGEKLGTAMVKENAATVTEVGQALRTQKRMKSGGQIIESSVRVGTKRLDRLIDMVGELVIAHSMVAQDGLVVNSNHHDLIKKVGHTSKIVRELQDISMSMRMIPLKPTFNKMARLVRDLSRKVGKNITFITEGEDTEIDRNLVDVINDPLVHMVRNAVDHGIETPDVRQQNEKPAHGTVKLSAYHSAGNVVVEIKDDGKGLDRKTIINKAVEKGIIHNGDSLSDREVFNLIFEPGFSTAKTVTDVSGRGVGMDVVKKNIDSLHGQVEIRSELGKGSIFKMSLPLTLAIIDGMVVRVGQETYIIPTVSIVRSIKPTPEDISSVHNQGQMLLLQDRLIPLFRMADLYDINTAIQEHDDPALVVVVEDEERQAGLLIDELIGRQQVVIKTLGQSMRDIPGVSGGAILPNGRVGLILDVGGLMKFATQGEKKSKTEEQVIVEESALSV